MEPLLKVRGIYKTFGEREVLKNISFELYPSDILGVIGPNGAGKSTLLYILLGIIIPEKGEIYYFGRNLFHERSSILKKVGFASQYVSLPYSLTVKENLMVFSYLYEVKNPDKKIEELLNPF